MIGLLVVVQILGETGVVTHAANPSVAPEASSQELSVRSAVGAGRLQHGVALSMDGGYLPLGIDGILGTQLRAVLGGLPYVDLVLGLGLGIASAAGYEWTPRFGTRYQWWRKGRWVLGGETVVGFPIHSEAVRVLSDSAPRLTRWTYLNAVVVDTKATLSFWPARFVELALSIRPRLSMGVSAFNLEAGIGTELLSNFRLGDHVWIFLAGGAFKNAALVQGEDALAASITDAKRFPFNILTAKLGLGVSFL